MGGGRLDKPRDRLDPAEVEGQPPEDQLVDPIGGNDLRPEGALAVVALIVSPVVSPDLLGAPLLPDRRVGVTADRPAALTAEEDSHAGQEKAGGFVVGPQAPGGLFLQDLLGVIQSDEGGPFPARHLAIDLHEPRIEEQAPGSGLL